MVLQGGTSPWLKITLRQAYEDVSSGENLCAAFQGCFSGQGPCSRTWFWVGMDGGGQISPSLSNLVHFLMRTVVICSVSHLSCCSSGAGISGFVLFNRGNRKVVKRRVRARAVISSPPVTGRMRQGRVPGPYRENGQPAPAVVPSRHGRVTSYAQQISSGVSWLSVSLGLSQSPSTPWCPFCLNVV